MILLAASTSIPWAELQRWSPARRMAALVVIGQSNGGEMDWSAGRMRWPQSGQS